MVVVADVPEDDASERMLLHVAELGFYAAGVFVGEELVRLGKAYIRDLRLLIPLCWIILQEFFGDFASDIVAGANDSHGLVSLFQRSSPALRVDAKSPALAAQ